MKKYSKKSAILWIIFSCSMAIVVSVIIFPLLLESETVVSVGHMYPNYSLTELAEEADAIECCKLSKIMPSKLTTNDTGGEIVTTDYVFTSLESDRQIAVRVLGGTMGDITVINQDGILECFNSEEKYVLFLNECVESDESYYTLVTGKASVFCIQFESSVSDDTMIIYSADNQYAVQYKQLAELIFSK
ncbi:MAG: hypothetical protein IJY50_05935 [Clostridia bacterium]|nr:hypothetical protein [Clostridia bacterium]